MAAAPPSDLTYGSRGAHLIGSPRGVASVVTNTPGRRDARTGRRALPWG